MQEDSKRDNTAEEQTNKQQGNNTTNGVTIG